MSDTAEGLSTVISDLLSGTTDECVYSRILCKWNSVHTYMQIPTYMYTYTYHMYILSGFFLLSIIFLTFTHIVACISSSFSLLSSFPLYGCSPVCPFQHLNCFQFGAIRKKAAMNIVYCLCVDICFHFFGADT